MSGEKFWVDERTGRVHRVQEPYVAPETARLERKRAAKARARRDAAKKARKRNRRRK